MGFQQRRQSRISVAMEVRIRGTDRSGLSFEETTSSDNVSRSGCSLPVSHELDLGTELEVEILRRIPGRTEPSPFLTRGVVMRSVPIDVERYMIGIQFTGPRFPTYSSENTTPGGA